MANPNRTFGRMRERALNRYGRNLNCVAERVFNTQAEAETWLETQTGDVKRVTSFKVGRRSENHRAYAARVYMRDRGEATGRG